MMNATRYRFLHGVFMVIVVSASILLAGCTHFRTPRHITAVDTEGIAIHLDAHERLVLYRAQQYCAEPSPDALQAYASALGVGGSAPLIGALSVAATQQSIAGSIGLRTQTITIMRDALFRMCEAYHNGILGDVMVATLLGRSQDLTAVILAVEQLTGAVAANQVVLTSSSSANASANLVANNEALTTARKSLDEREAAIDEATTTRDAANEALGTARTTEEAAVVSLSAATGATPTNAEMIAAAQAALARAQEDRQQAEEDLRRAEATLATQNDLLENAQQVVASLEATMDAALSNATANAAGAGQFSVVQPRRQLSDDATREIASAVQSMVSKVLDKSYTVPSCMALLTSRKSSGDNIKTVRDLCLELVQRGLETEIMAISSNYEPTEESLCIRNSMDSDATLRGRLQTWLRDTKNLRISVGYFLDSRDFGAVRQEAVEFFELQCEVGG